MLLLSCTLAACSSSSGAGDTQATQQSQQSSSARAVSQSDADIATLIYSDTQRTPAGFYTESMPVTSAYVTTKHLRNTDIADSGALHELCTDDWNQALSWSTGLHSSDGAQLVGNDANELYFEVSWLKDGTPQNYLRERIFKCAYVDRSDVDLASVTGSAGVLNLRPLSLSALQQLNEYLWQFSRYNNFGNVVLKSAVSSNGSLSHSLIIATLTRAGTGSCDAIDVASLDLAADNDGALQTSLNPLWTFHAQQVNNVVSLCP